MPTVPAAYAWLANINPLPRVITQALQLIGTTEVVGTGSNKTIIGWRDELNQSGIRITGFSDDDIPWCGLFAAVVAHRASKPVVENPLWARNWAKFGRSEPTASLGDVLVFQRPGGGGHVGFYIAHDAQAYHVLGGNQGNRVSITRIERNRCIAVRRPPYLNMPGTVKPYLVAQRGGLSTNEA